MIDTRKRGLMTLQGFITILLLPTWFLAVAAACHIFGLTILFEQINFPLYLLGVVLAGVLTSNVELRAPDHDSDHFRWVAAIRRTNTGVFIVALVLFGIVFATKDKAMSRIFLGLYVVSVWGVLLFLNRYLRDWLSTLAFRGANTVNTVLVGSAASVERIEDWIRDQPPIGVRVVGLVTYDGEEKTENGAGIPIIGHVSNFAEILNKNEAGQAILLETRRSKAWVNFVVSTCYREGCRLLILNPWEEYFNQPLTPIDEGAHTFFTMQVEPLENPFNRFLKRVVDIAVSLPVVVLVLPMLSLFVAIGHRIQAPGPLVYRQSRSGLRGRTFTIFKFRSMHHYEQPEGDNTTEQAKKRDTRIFPFGHFLRRTSLDEFPQFLNVLKGNMSLVGPRPHMPEHDELFKQLVEIYRTRHFVKPGITGLAQYRGYRGEITDPELLRERIRLDLEYINNWSIWLDLGLILRTATQVFIPPESAY